MVMNFLARFIPKVRPQNYNSVIKNLFTKRYASDHHKKIEIGPSDHIEGKAYDIIHYYFVLYSLPFLALNTWLNIRYGKAELVDYDPKEFTPEEWETDEAFAVPRFLSWLYGYNPDRVNKISHDNIHKLSEAKKKVAEDRWFTKSEYQNKDYRGWFFIPANPYGSNRSLEEYKLDQEMGRTVYR